MQDRLTRMTRPELPEIFRMNKNVSAKNIEEFANLARHRFPKQISVSVAEIAKTYSGYNATPENVDYYLLATQMSFAVNKNGIALINYSENYPDGKVEIDPIKDGYSEKHLAEMNLRAILTATNRVSRLKSLLTGFNIPVAYSLKLRSGLKELTEDEMQAKREEAWSKRLTPFFI